MKLNQESINPIRRFVNGEITWAQVEGMTADEAKRIADVGCDLAANGRLEEARIIFEGLVAINPFDAAARAALGTVYQKLERLDDAFNEYTEAITLDAENAVALGNRGELLLKRGDERGYVDLTHAVKADSQGETTAGRRAAAIIKAFTLKAIEAAKKS